ncbi:MAG: hypothetical protein PHW73_01080 [Atribacterota bacterium]|nr:hypothetical protein [Atribacterota bacterium]
MKTIKLIIIGIWFIITIGAIQQFKQGIQKEKENYAKLKNKEHRVVLTSNGLFCDIDKESVVDDRVWIVPFGWLVASFLGFAIIKDLK